MPATSIPPSSNARQEPEGRSWADALASARNPSLPAPAVKLIDQLDGVISSAAQDTDRRRLLVASSTKDLVRSFSILPEREFRELMTELNRLRDHSSQAGRLWKAADELADRRRESDGRGDASMSRVANAEIDAEMVKVWQQMQGCGSPNMHEALLQLSDRWAGRPEALLTLGMIHNVFVNAFNEDSRAPQRYLRGERVPDGEFATDLEILVRISRTSGIPIRNAQLERGIDPDFPSDHRISLYSGTHEEVRSVIDGVTGAESAIRIEISTPRGRGDDLRRTIQYFGSPPDGPSEREMGVLTPGQSIIFGRPLRIRALFAAALILPESLAIEPEIASHADFASRAALRISWLKNDQILVEDLGGRRPWGFSHGPDGRSFTRGVFDPGQPSKPGGPIGPDGFTEFF